MVLVLVNRVLLGRFFVHQDPPPYQPTPNIVCSVGTLMEINASYNAIVLTPESVEVVQAVSSRPMRPMLDIRGK